MGIIIVSVHSEHGLNVKNTDNSVIVCVFGMTFPHESHRSENYVIPDY